MKWRLEHHELRFREGYSTLEWGEKTLEWGEKGRRGGGEVKGVGLEYLENTGRDHITRDHRC